MESSLTSATSPPIARRRPLAVWPLALVLAILAFLTAVGGVIFNLSGADSPAELLGGLVFLALASLYALCAVRIPAGNALARRAALAAVTVHGTFNLVVKVAIEGETESIMFVVLALLAAALLTLPSIRRLARA